MLFCRVWRAHCFVAIVLLAGAGCGPKPVKISGTVTGLLANTSVTLQNNGVDDVVVTENGRFYFATAIDLHSSYEVTVKEHPTGPAQRCTLVNSAGTTTGEVSNVSVTCSPRAKQLGSAADDYAYAAALDASSNSFVAGSSAGAFDGGVSAGSNDLVLVKYDVKSNKVWSRQLGSSGDDRAMAVIIDANGNVFVAGHTTGNLDENTNNGGVDYFVVKYDSNGGKQWTRQSGTAGDDIATGIARDGAGNVYVTGYTDGALDSNTSSGGNDFFIVKYDGNGTKAWTQQAGTSSDDQAKGIAGDASGNLIVGGVTSGGLDGNSNAGGVDSFVVKYDANGVKQWTRQLGTAADDVGLGVALDANGATAIAGSTGGTFPGQTNGGGTDLFVASYDVSGNNLWTKQFGSSGDDGASGVASDSTGNVYVAGASTGAFDANSHSDDNGQNDLIVMKCDATGAKLWSVMMGATGADRATGIASDSAGNTSVSGFTNGGLAGNAGAGGDDFVMLRFDASGNQQ